jgi:hypothetical protein
MMRKLIEEYVGGDPVYVFTTQGHLHVGRVDEIDAGGEVFVMRAPDGRTRVHLNLSDVSGVRAYLPEPEDLS